MDNDLEMRDAIAVDDDGGDGDEDSLGGDEECAGEDGETKKSGGRVKGPWSENEDAVLSQIVGNFGARNWSLIAKAIPGRSGKSCRLRWCNQLDPALKRKPFTDEEDRLILEAHSIHGNKWAAIARLLPGRTDNAIKNHWNSALRRRAIEPGKSRLEPGNGLEDASGDKSKASSEETLSCGDVSSYKSLEGKDVNSLETDDINTDKVQTEYLLCNEAKDPPTLYKPVPRISAFSIYNPLDGPEPVVQHTGATCSQSVLFPPKPDAGMGKLLEGTYGERLVPRQCGYGCCGASTEKVSKSSLLGPEFSDYEEPPSFPCHELAALAAEISNIAWLKSGLDNSNVKAPDHESGQLMMLRGYHVQMGHIDESKKNVHSQT